MIVLVLLCGSQMMAQEIGFASFYHVYFNGKKTASGEIYDDNKMTCAHKSLPIGTILKVTNLENDRSVIVRVNDRGPYVRDRILDLTRSAATKLGYIQQGFARVTYEIIQSNIIEIKDTGTVASAEPSSEKFYQIAEVDTATKMLFGIKIGSYEDPKYVFSISRDIKVKFGLTAFIQNVKLIRGSLYRIFVGNYSTQEEAEEQSKKFKKLYPDCKAIKYESFK